MRSRLLFLTALLLALALAGPSTAAAVGDRGFNRVTSPANSSSGTGYGPGWVGLSGPNVNDPIIGYLFYYDNAAGGASDHMDIFNDYPTSTYPRGHAYGQFNGCAYAYKFLNFFLQDPNPHSANCTPAYAGHSKAWLFCSSGDPLCPSSGVYEEEAPGGLPTYSAYAPTSTSCPMYANLGSAAFQGPGSPSGTPRNRLGYLAHGTPVQVRYVTKAATHVMVKVPASVLANHAWGPGIRWVFIRRACIPGPTPPGQWAAGHGVGSQNQFLADVTGDRRADAVVYFQNSGSWYVAPSNGGGFNGYYQAATGHGVGSWNRLMGDVTADGRDDALVYFGNSGSWYIAPSNGTTFNGYYQATTGHGVGSYNQFLADVNGDRGEDAIVYFESSGSWYVAHSNGSGFNGYYQATTGHGVGSWRRLVGDVNGDGRDDAIVYFGNSGSWYVALSNGHTFNGYYTGIAGHGVGSSNQFLADATGDGRDDAIVYFQDSGRWYVAPSNGSTFNGYFLWRDGHGVGSNNQLMGDVNGDGKDDPIVYFGNNGSWYAYP